MTATTNTNSIPPVYKVPHIGSSQEMQFFITGDEGVGGRGQAMGMAWRADQDAKPASWLLPFVCLHCLLV